MLLYQSGFSAYSALALTLLALAAGVVLLPKARIGKIVGIIIMVLATVSTIGILYRSIQGGTDGKFGCHEQHGSGAAAVPSVRDPNWKHPPLPEGWEKPTTTTDQPTP